MLGRCWHVEKVETIGVSTFAESICQESVALPLEIDPLLVCMDAFESNVLLIACHVRSGHPCMHGHLHQVLEERIDFEVGVSLSRRRMV